MATGYGKTLINGTAYDIKNELNSSGEIVSCNDCLVGGTKYVIDSGKTLINGTAYDIPLLSFIPFSISGSSTNFEAPNGVWRNFINSKFNTYGFEWWRFNVPNFPSTTIRYNNRWLVQSGSIIPSNTDIVEGGVYELSKTTLYVYNTRESGSFLGSDETGNQGAYDVWINGNPLWEVGDNPKLSTFGSLKSVEIAEGSTIKVRVANWNGSGDARIYLNDEKVASGSDISYEVTNVTNDIFINLHADSWWTLDDFKTHSYWKAYIQTI